MILTSLVCNRTTWRSQFWSSRSRIGPKNLHSYKLQVTLTLLVHDSHSGEHHSEGLQSLQSMAISPELTSVLCHRQTYCEVDEVDCQALTPMAPSRTYLVVCSGWRCFGDDAKGRLVLGIHSIGQESSIFVIPSHFCVLGVLVQELLLGWSYHPFCWCTNTDQMAHALQSVHSTNPRKPVGGVGRNKVWNGICGNVSSQQACITASGGFSPYRHLGKMEVLSYWKYCWWFN